MEIAGSTVLVTGANRGLGQEFVKAALAAGAAKVYAAARRPETVTVPGVVPIALDVTDPESARAAAEAAGDVQILINNAGSFTGADLLGGDLADIRTEMDTHYYGTLSVSRAFAPVLARNGGGAVLNVLSVLSWITTPETSAYSAAKSAAWSLTNALRVALDGQGTQVTALHVGYMDTDMTAHVDAPKSDPAHVAAAALDGLAAGAHEVLADELSRTVKAGLSADVAALYPALATAAR
jgi:NAD(P)-dependent dehydrogenase (short-subunit alcohol dehydrogenase family)